MQMVPQAVDFMESAAQLAPHTAIRPMFRQAFRNRRILVPADAFYEWRRLRSGKQPYLIHMKDGTPFGMGGLMRLI